MTPSRRLALLAACVCLSLFAAACNDEKAVTPTCTDGKRNGTETDVDCGGTCGPCGDGKACGGEKDCLGHYCANHVCGTPTCTDTVKNGTETGIDCGGSCPGKCGPGEGCASENDCASGVCHDGKCEAATCSDHVKNGGEGDVDCGGNCPEKCGPGSACAGAGDCASGVCQDGKCVAPGCGDHVQNGDETDVDCGGTCGACPDGNACGAAKDCQSGVCENGRCQAATCTDHVRNGDEADVDCGGSCGATCGGSATCGKDADCISGFCVEGHCIAPCDADLQTDPNHCGRCDIACPAPTHAAAACRAGKCGRFACDPGHFDFDPAIEGCETACAGKTCTKPDGTTVTLTNPPIPESGAAFQGTASGSSFGGAVQTSAGYTNVGVLGDSTPPASAQQPVLQNGSYKNRGGLVSRPR